MIMSKDAMSGERMLGLRLSIEALRASKESMEDTYREFKGKNLSKWLRYDIDVSCMRFCIGLDMNTRKLWREAK